ncbi:hypothetical protein BDZ89DRAFT_1073548 [Hymenopellis radicata]|nr:hypothetical protein BDZ89DRAFT_1073548 [Hymenopellis radicata]
MSASSSSFSSTSSSSSFCEGQARRQALFNFSAPTLERKRNQRVPIPAALSGLTSIAAWVSSGYRW